MKQLLLILLIILSYSNILLSQCPNTDFNVPASVCKGENIELQNLTTNGYEYFWDFCSGDLELDPTISQVTTVSASSPRNIKIVFDGSEWWGFVLSRSDNKIIRLSFGSNLASTPTVSNLGNVGNLLSTPDGFDILKEKDNWYGLVTNNSNSLVLIDFGPKLNNTPTATQIPIGANVLNQPRVVVLVREAEKVVALIGNFGNDQIIRVDFGSSIKNESYVVSSFYITGTSGIIGMSITEECGNYYGLVSSFWNGAIHKINFGSSALNNPTTNLLSSTVSSPGNLKIIKDGSSYYCLVPSNTGDLHKFSFGSSMMNNSPTYLNMGNFSALTGNFGFDVVKEHSVYYAFPIGTSNNIIHKVKFANECSGSTSTIKAFLPDKIQYENAGTYKISLTSRHINGNESSVTKQIMVLDQKAPMAQVNQGDNQCLTNPITLSSENLTPDQTISSHIWTFPDGSQQTTAEASYQFAQPGTYKVLLNIESENGCGNYYEKEVTVYPEPQAAYELSATLACTNTGITFTNLTDFPEESVISYSWDFGDGTTSVEKSPVHEFGTAGIYEVLLTASIPGCSTTSAKTIEVQSGPQTLFEAQPVCDEHKVVFENKTTGADISGYEWDLGDGTTSVVKDPEHIYDEPGTYLVLLQTSSTLGCVSSYTQSVRVYSNPVPDFTTSALCEGADNAVEFTDASTDADGNFDKWLWEFEMPDGLVITSTAKDTTIVYPQAGTYGVTLSVTTNWTCKSTIRKLVEIQAVPDITIGLEGGCLGAPSQLTDLSETNGVKVQSRLWMIGDKVSGDSTFSYTFPKADVYEVVLQVNLENGCSVRDTLLVEVTHLPEVKFTAKGTCQGQTATFSALTPAEEYVWNIDGKVITGEGPDIQYVFKEAGIHTVSLTVQDERGCANTITKEFDAGQPPVAAFSTDRNKGVPPFEVSFTNESQDGATYLWLFGDAQGGRSILENPVFTFSEIRDYEVQLITYNAAGCADTASQIISVVAPNYDVVLTSVNLLRQNDQTLVVAGLENAGTIRVTDMDIEVLINNEYTITEKFEGGLEIGQKENYTLKTQLNENGKRPIRFICVELKPVLTLVKQELSTENNKRCHSLDQAFVMQEPFPNPGQDMVRLEFLLPEPGTVSITVYSAEGKLVEKAELTDMKAELNRVNLPIHHLGKGIYFLRARFGSEEVNFRIMKN